jgi:hypothetical protein
LLSQFKNIFFKHRIYTNISVPNHLPWNRVKLTNIQGYFSSESSAVELSETNTQPTISLLQTLSGHMCIPIGIEGIFNSNRSTGWKNWNLFLICIHLIPSPAKPQLLVQTLPSY